MARRRKLRQCDAPGCTVEVKRGILMCRAHWFATPRPLREAITAAWKERRIRDWSANCLAARSYHAGAAPPAPRITAERAFELNQRLMGEH